MIAYLKRLCFLTFLVFLASPVRAEVDTLWTRVYDFGGASQLLACSELQSGGFVAVGYRTNATSEDALIMRINPLGDTSWVRTFGITNMQERLYDVVEMPDGTLLACGYAAGSLVTMTAAYTPLGEQLWVREFDPPSGASQAAAVLPADDGGFYVLARKMVSNRDLDFWLIRCDANGDSLWSNTYGTPRTDVPDALLPGLDGGLEMFGSSRHEQNLIFDLFHVSTDAAGTELASTVIGDAASWETLAAACHDPESGDYIIAGEASEGQPRHGYALRLAADGSVLWEEHYTGGRASEKISGVAPYLEGGAFLAGWTGTTVLAPQLWLLAVGVNGDTSWTWSGQETGWAFEDLAKLSDGGFLACGRALIGGYQKGIAWRFSPPSGVSGIVRDRVTMEPVEGVWIAAAELPQYSISDTLGRFSLSLPPGNYTVFSGGPCFTGDTLYSIEVVANENTLSDITVGVAHMTMEHTTINVVAENHVMGSAELLMTNAGSGDLVYSFGAETYWPATDWLSVSPSSGRLAPGDSLVALVNVLTDTLDNGTYDYFGKIYLHSNSCPDTLLALEVLAVILDAESGLEVPTEFALYPAYPNPFNSSTRIRFGVDHDTDVSLTVFDLQGREVARILSSERLSAGQHEITWDATGLASGIYFVRLQDPLRTQSQRILFLR